MSAAGDEGDHGVRRVTVEVLPGPVVDRGGPGVGVASGDLNIAQWDAGVEGVMNAARSMCGCTWSSPARLPIE